jgi:hypothetical protein
MADQLPAVDMSTFKPTEAEPANPNAGLPAFDPSTFKPNTPATATPSPQAPAPAGTSDIKEGEAEIPGTTGFENTSASTSSGRGLPTAPKEAVNEGLKREASVGAAVAALPFAPIITAGIAAAGGGALSQAVGTGGGMGFLNSVAEDIARGENPTEFHHLNKTAQQTVLGMVLGGLFHGAGAAYSAVTTPAEGEAPNFVQKVLGGSKVAQAPAKSAMASRAAAANTGAGAAADTNAGKLATSNPDWAYRVRDAADEAENVGIPKAHPESHGQVSANEHPEWADPKTGRGNVEDKLHPNNRGYGPGVNRPQQQVRVDMNQVREHGIPVEVNKTVKTPPGVQPELRHDFPKGLPEAYVHVMPEGGWPAAAPAEPAGVPEPPTLEPTQGAKPAPVAKPAPAAAREALGPAITDAGKAADASYAKIDEVAGTDFKKTAQDIRDYNKKIFQAHNPTDAAAWAKKRDDAELLLDTAKNYAKAAGVGPEVLEEASSQFKRMSALRDVERFVYKNSSVIDPTTGEVNVKAAVRQLQKLQDNVKYGGPRLEQAGMGELLEDMKAAQRLGIDALNKQQWAKMMGRIAFYTAVGTGAAHEVARAVTRQ